MVSLRAFMSSPLARKLREDIAIDPPAPVFSDEELAKREGKPVPRVRPDWAVGECSICAAFLKKHHFFKCKLCPAIVCKSGNCADFHGLNHRQAQRKAATLNAA